MRRLIAYTTKPTLWTRLARYLPVYQYELFYNNRVINGIIMPQIQSCLEKETSAGRGKTLADVALGDLRAEYNGGNAMRQHAEYISDFSAQIRLFMFAGHHATAQAM